jgi:hypothetical protein
MAYPDAIDNLVDVTGTQTLASAGHSARHNDANDALRETRDYLVGALGSKLNIAGGKILQIVRATDSTARSTNSTSFVDVTGMSVTITPQFSSSKILVICTGNGMTESIDTNADNRMLIRIVTGTTSVSGAQRIEFGTLNYPIAAAGHQFFSPIFLLGLHEPNSTNSITYKAQMQATSTGQVINFRNAVQTGQMYAIEVSA